jgi:hypothetical protein
MALSRRSGSLVSHSHITHTSQPIFRRDEYASSSRSTLRRNLSNQNETFDFGILALGQSSCRCQKHPWTKRTRRCFGNTRSGFPGKSLRWSRNLSPRPCATLRTRSSGDVFLLPTRDMSHERRAGGIWSATVKQQPFSILLHPQAFPKLHRERLARPRARRCFRSS